MQPPPRACALTTWHQVEQLDKAQRLLADSRTLYAKLLGDLHLTARLGMTLERFAAEDLREYLRSLKDRHGQIVGARRRDNVRNEIVTLLRFARANRYLSEDRQTEAERIKRIKPVPWLLPWRNATGYVYPEVKKQTIKTLRLEKVTGLDWVNNGRRHSYATHRMAEVSNAGQVAEEMGTSIGRIKANYDAVPADITPAAYFSIEIDPETASRIIDMQGKAI